MSLIVTKTVYEKLDEGLHNGTITKIEDLGNVESKKTGKTEPRAQLIFESASQKDKEGKPVEGRVSFNQKLSDQSRLGILLKELGVNAGDQFDLNDLVGLKAQAVVEHVTKEGVTYANITKFIKVRKEV